MSGTILYARSRFYHWSGVGALSIKTFPNGQAHYAVGDARYLVDERHYLLLNQGQEYSIVVDAPALTESFCIFFPSGFAEAVAHSLATTTDQLLDHPAGMTAPISFFERTYPHDQLVSPLVAALRQVYWVRQEETSWLDEPLHQLMTHLLLAHNCVKRESDQLAAARPATRAELYQRLWRAYDYIAAGYDQPLTLAQIAHTAALSPNHLLRSFKQLFHQTPHQALTQKRLEQAQRLLRQTDHPVTDICFAVGFASLGSFSSLFRRHIGCSPE